MALYKNLKTQSVYAKLLHWGGKICYGIQKRVVILYVLPFSS